MLRTLFLLAVVVFFGAALRAADLKVGDAAPPLKVAKWIQGKPMALSEGKGKNIYVVEFWATWCGPCRTSIPHLNRMAARFEKQNVVFIGVSVDGEDTRDEVEPFVTRMGKKMTYPVALDDQGGTNQAYMEAAGVNGIPHSFIVDKEGKLSWHGHPMDGLGLRIAEMVGDKGYAEAAKKLTDEEEKLRSAWRAKKWDDALAALDQLIALEPEEVERSVHKYVLLATRKKDREAAEKLGATLAGKLDDGDLLNEIAWTILTGEDFEGARDLKLALTMAKKANDLTKGQNWSILDTLARAHFDTGSAKEAVETQKKAIEIATKEKAEDEQIETLKEALQKFEAGASKDKDAK